MTSTHEQMAQQTKKTIQMAFIELVHEEGFHNVSVKKIAERAGINRGTFYLHYVDKFELMAKVQEELLRGIQGTLKNINPKDAFLIIQHNQLYPPFVSIFNLSVKMLFSYVHY